MGFGPLRARELLMGLDSELDTGAAALDVDAEFGGREARLLLERKLLRKLDVRMSILVLIYILNYVRPFQHCLLAGLRPSSFIRRLTEITLRECVNVYSAAQPRLISSFSAARLEGFEADLHLKGQQFDTLISTFYAGYILMQIPS
jgi:hypothetical protein